MIVADTNLIAYAMLPGEHTKSALRIVLRDPEWVAPTLWRHEFRNVLATAMRVGGLDLSRALGAFEAAEELVIDGQVHPTVEECLRLAARGKISAHDAQFVYLAERLDLPLVSADRRLCKAFPDRAIPLGTFADGG